MNTIFESVKKKIGGMDDVIEELLHVICCLQNGTQTPLLITGSIGSGKSYIVNEVVKSTGIPSLSVQCSSIMQPTVGESEKYLDSIESFAETHSPCIILFDDLEILLPCSSAITSSFQYRISSQVFDFLRSIALQKKPVLVIGIVSESQLTSLNYQICCSSFMNHVINIPKLDKERRKAIISLYFQNPILVNHLTEETASYSAADLCQLCSECIVQPTETFIQQQLTIHQSSIVRQFHTVKPLEGGFTSLYGVSSIIESVRKYVLRPLLHPELFSQYNLQPPAGAIFYGPSGCGKSLMVQAIAAETVNEIQVMDVVCTDLLGKYLGDSEKHLHDIFTLAKQASPCILVLDNIESLAQKRGNDMSEEKTFDRLLSCMLTELDGIYSSTAKQIFVIGITQNISLLDSSILRPGRLEVHIPFTIPTPPARKDMLTHLLQDIEMEDRESVLSWLVLRTSDYTFADLKGLIMRSIMKVVQTDSKMCRDILLSALQKKDMLIVCCIKSHYNRFLY